MNKKLLLGFSILSLIGTLFAASCSNKTQADSDKPSSGGVTIRGEESLTSDGDGEIIWGEG